ncbi:MAG: two-component system chemotaxis sensor kinase CheA [Candidatus Omnitrophota bacterium]|jgi:two-component system chemotaxis sensor kinase CheA
MSDSFEMSEEQRIAIMVEFISESENNIDTLNENLLQCETLIKDGQTIPSDVINAMFRIAHTIKGTASFMGLNNISRLTHELETILSRIRNQEDDLEFTFEVIDIFFNTLDTIAGLLSHLRKVGNDDVDIDSSLNKIAEAVVIANKEIDVSNMTPQEKDNNAKYLAIFLEDTDSHVNRFNDILMAIEKKEFESDYLDELFRIAHTIKGSAGIVQRPDIEVVAHQMEDLFSRLRESKQAPDEPTVAVMFKFIDWVSIALDAMREGQTQALDTKAIIDHVQGLAGCSKTKTDRVMQTQKPQDIDLANLNEEESNSLHSCFDESLTCYYIQVTLSAPCQSKSLKAIVVAERLKKAGVLIKASVADNEIDDALRDELNVQYIFCTKQSLADVEALLSVSEVQVDSVKEENIAKPSETEEKMVVNDPIQPNVQEVDSKVTKDDHANRVPQSIEVTTMRIDTHKLDSLINLAGELVITRARFTQLVDDLSHELNQTNSRSESKAIESKLSHLSEATNVLEKISGNIQSGVMQIRMTPIEGLFTRFRRLVRDTSKELGKNVTFNMYGEDTELDKKIIDELGDPLVHMIRNAIGHGLESNEDRAAAGKSESGGITLGASHQGSNICIEISDDGRGLDIEKIVQKSVEKGLITKEDAEQMSEAEIYDLIFSPGFSTAEQVTGLSGRGVGMDVVKRMINSLKGSIDIESEQGQGTKFLIRIPLTLAIIRGLLVVVDEQVYTFPLEVVSEIIDVKIDAIHSVDGNETITLRDHALSLMDLETVLEVKGRDKLDKKSRPVVVIQEGERKMGLVVDRLIGEEEIVIKSLPLYFKHVIGVSGASILGDGQIALILDAGAIFKKA